MKPKQRYQILIGFMGLSLLVYLVLLAGRGYYLSTNPNGELEVFLQYLAWGIQVELTGVSLLLLLPLGGLLLANWRKNKELSVGFMYAEIYAGGVALLLWMGSSL